MSASSFYFGLEILQRSEKKQEVRAGVILPPIQLLVYFCIPDLWKLFIYVWTNISISMLLRFCVTFVLFFGEVIPQAICTRYISSNVVCIVMIIWYQIGYLIVKILDCVLGYNKALFRRAQLKAIASIHSKEEGKSGELTHDETTFLSGALDLLN